MLFVTVSNQFQFRSYDFEELLGTIQLDTCRMKTFNSVFIF